MKMLTILQVIGVICYCTSLITSLFKIGRITSIKEFHRKNLHQQDDNTLVSNDDESLELPSFHDILNISKSTLFAADSLPITSSWLLAKEVRKDTSNIPKVVHKVYIQKSGGFQDMSKSPLNLTEAHFSWEKYNHGYHVQYFDLVLCRKYLATYFHPIFLRTFDCLQNFAGKCDFFRMAVLYREGGWYSDWKEVCLEENLLDKLSAKGEDLVLFYDEGLTAAGGKTEFANAFLGAAPRHPLIAKMLELQFHHIQTSHYQGGTFGVLNATGPMVLGAAWRRAKLDNIVKETNIQGKYNVSGLFFDLEDKKVIQHKCTGCGLDQKWEHGNVYWKMYRLKTFYCEDSASIYF